MNSEPLSESMPHNRKGQAALALGQAPPALDDARDLIQEVLVQRGITEQADRWLKESRARLHVEKLTSAGLK